MTENNYDMNPEEIYGEGEGNATDDQSQAYQMAVEIDKLAEGLTDWEIGFIADIIDRSKAYRLTHKQMVKISQIHEKTVG